MRKQFTKEDSSKGGKSKSNKRYKLTTETAKIARQKGLEKLTPEQRTLIARHAIETRWKRYKERQENGQV